MPKGIWFSAVWLITEERYFVSDGGPDQPIETETPSQETETSPTVGY